jgi:ribosomal protein S12 methylthiotransferase accessory factor
LLESVEHDGWAVWQANRIRCPRVDPESVDSEEIQSWLREIGDSGLEVVIRDRRTDLDIPTFRVWLVDDTRPQVFASRGDGAHLDREVALRRALTEAQHKLAHEDHLAWGRALTRSPRRLLDANRSVFSISGLAPFELTDDWPEIKFKKITDYSTGEVVGDIEETVARISATVPCSDVVVVDLTDPHLGIPTVRVITVGLQRTGEPLTSVLPRLFDLPVRLGRRDRRLEYRELFNGRYPH